MDSNQRVTIVKTDGTAIQDSTTRLPVTAHSSIGNDVTSGLIFTAGDEIALAAGEAGSLVIENPSDSGVTIVVLSFSVYNSVATSIDVVFFEDPTVTGGTTLTPFDHNFATGNTSNAVVKAGQGILSGGTELHAHVRTVRDQAFSFQGAPIIIPPNKILALQTTAPGGLSGGADISTNITYKEIAN